MRGRMGVVAVVENSGEFRSVRGDGVETPEVHTRERPSPISSVPETSDSTG